MCGRRSVRIRSSGNGSVVGHDSDCALSCWAVLSTMLLGNHSFHVDLEETVEAVDVCMYSHTDEAYSAKHLACCHDEYFANG